jgi:hypothetical protein
MTEQMAERRDVPAQPTTREGWTTGLALFAAIIMIMGGVFQAIAGLVALLEDEFFVATPNYTFAFDVTTWGWIHLVVGVVVALAGFAVMSGRTWARVVGITLAVLSALTNFAFIPYYPVWALLIIALDVFVIWALAVYRPAADEW